ncbi:uncharacterized protein LOC144441974 isoform X2 [Glandiceps talaboti]
MKLQLKEEEKSNQKLEKTVITMEIGEPKPKTKQRKEIVRSHTMDSAKVQSQPVRRRRQHKHHRSDEYPMYNKDGSRSILAQLLQSESTKGQGKVVSQMSKSMDNLHLNRYTSGAVPVFTTTIDLSKSLSHENITGQDSSELSLASNSSMQSTVTYSKETVESRRPGSNPSVVNFETNVLSSDVRTDVDTTNLDDRPPPPYPGHSRLFNAVDQGNDVISGQSNAESPEITIGTGSPQHDSFVFTGTDEECDSDSNCDMNESMQLDHEAIANRATQMVEILSEENYSLRQELEIYYQKVSKLQKFEQDVKKVENAYDQLVTSTAKREHLEKAMRAKLESEFRKTQEKNKELRGQVDTLSTQLQQKESPCSNDVDQLKRELRKRDAIIAQLIVQHKEHHTHKERVEVELSAQRATLSEQRTHIDVLDAALSSAQANVVRLQEECKKKQVYVDRVEKLQRAVGALQNACDKREQLEKKLRMKLEKEIEILRAQQNAVANQEHDEGVSLESPNNSHTLMVLLKERDEKIMSLESEVTKWEQRYHEEVALKHCVDPPSPTLSPKYQIPEISAEEEFQVEKMKQMEEAFAVSKKNSDLEARVKALQYELTEKNNMISSLQHQSHEKDRALSSLEQILRSSVSPQGSLQNITMKPQSRGLGSQESMVGMNLGLQERMAGMSLSQERMPGMSFSQERMTGMSLSQERMAGMSLSQERMAGMSLSQERMAGMSLSQERMAGMSLSQERMAGMSLSQERMAGMSLSQERMAGTNYGSQERMTGMNFGSQERMTGKGFGSQERMTGISNSYSSLHSSNPMLTTDFSLSDSSIDKNIKDERLKELDQELAQQDSILKTLHAPAETSSNFFKI